MGGLRSVTFPSFPARHANTVCSFHADATKATLTITPRKGTRSHARDPEFELILEMHLTKALRDDHGTCYGCRVNIYDDGKDYKGCLTFAPDEDGDQGEDCIRIDSLKHPEFYVEMPMRELKGDGVQGLFDALRANKVLNP